MNRNIQSPAAIATLFGLIAYLATGCGDATPAEGLSIEVSFAPGVPRSARDEAVRVGVYLVDSCDSVVIGQQLNDAIGNTFTLRDGGEGLPIDVPDPGQYGIYAVAQDSNCAVVGAGCNDVSVDADGQEILSVELGAFAGDACSASEVCFIDTGECVDSGDDCLDLDGDGLGNGNLGNAGCVNTTTDSNDGDVMVCADTDGDTCDDCSSGSFDPLVDGTDTDGDGVCDSGDVCVDGDGDGLGDGTLDNAGCSNTTTDSNDADVMVCADTDGDTCDDCSSGTFDPLDDGTDTDGDGICDVGDACVDADGDGLGNGTLGNTGCGNATTDSNDSDAATCADTDGDGCDDCAVTMFDPSNDGLDDDGDGTCAVTDCDDDKPLCAAVCTDVDDDGYCIDTDCDDVVRSCDLDCTTNTDGDTHVDCFETFCGSDPNSALSVCREASSDAEYKTAVDAANDNPGMDHIVLNDFIMATGAPAFDDDAGVTIRQVAGAALTVNSGGNRKVFELKSANNLIDGVRVVNVSNAEDVVEITGNNNTVQNCAFEGFERRGIYVDSGDNAQILHNIITGGTLGQDNERGAVILRDSAGSVIAGNTVTLNAMDGVQVRQAISPFIDHNTIADNGGSGVEFYGEASSNVCFRNNNVTGNADFGLHGDKVVTFDVTSACTGPLSPGPAYGNNEFGNAAGSCGGSTCTACACLPAGTFWEYSVDPLYTSTTAGDQNFYCLGAPSLIDGGNDLLSYDLNGAATGDFNGSGPDIGGREDGPGDCN